MKTKSMIPLILAAISLLLSCEKRIYIPEPTSYQLPDKTGNIPLDTTYHLYTRVIYRIQAAFIDQGTPSASGVSLPAALLTNDKTAARDSLSFLSGTRQKESVPIEVEYLFISNTHATAIYISGVADRFRERYSRADFKRNTPNADDFRVFLIGKLLRKGDTVTFYNPDGQQTDNWILNLADHGQAMFVNQIESKRFSNFEDVYLLREALAHNIPFLYQKEWWIIYRPHGQNGAADTLANSTAIAVGMPKKQKFTLQFSFPALSLVYSTGYVIYDPRKVF